MVDALRPVPRMRLCGGALATPTKPDTPWGCGGAPVLVTRTVSAGPRRRLQELRDCDRRYVL